MPADSHHPRNSEDVPFLSHHHHPQDATDDNDPPKQQPNNASPIQGNIRMRLMVTLFTMILAVEVGYVMAGGPMTRIYESIACHEHYLQVDPSKIGPDGQVPEDLCKGKEVQSELAAVKGYMEFFEGILSVFLAIPYGLMADRYGRRSVMRIGIPGFILNCVMVLVVIWFSDIFPLRAVWASCLAWLLGGGPVVALAIIYTMMSDVTTEEERAPMFFKFGVAGMGADFVSSAASSWLMVLNPWIPLLIGYSVVIVGMLFALSLPETKNAFPARATEPPTEVELGHLSPDGDTKGLSGGKLAEDSRSGSDDTEDPTFATGAKKRPFLASLRMVIRSYLTPYAFIFRARRILLLLTAFLVYRLSRGSSWFLIQYISTRYNWTLAEANFLISFKPALTIPLFLLILPMISRYLLRTMKSNKKDLLLARASIIFLAVGTLGIGLSPNIAMLIPSLLIQTSGSGFVYLTRSLVTTLVHREETARLFTVIEVLQSIGNVIASVSITTVFQIGLELGGPWIGIAWMMTATAFCLVGVAIWTFRVPSVAHDKLDDYES
ncbi:hypothetical protein P175DRAFT_0503160 [Aspergillus ochraceoroseus IBT 24754]|uniref:Major facilitator superfamily (MFS) profile domain-containing protein n=1 Tax=Aspergillus ochraceoroseus IBT 24754 TaxID=1392256 RepID=A0A2T5LTL5_9EURO|nr:uncharacterized protein P175DRAFT_0503160 [Aspergillus ochraceoroseus IBT 24754]PTU19621.1 hypothetical protein P175DRAFT_0503160 [Aspergillus ochraceoroseus IBT 24754]